MLLIIPPPPPPPPPLDKREGGGGATDRLRKRRPQSTSAIHPHTDAGVFGVCVCIIVIYCVLDACGVVLFV